MIPRKHLIYAVLAILIISAHTIPVSASSRSSRVVRVIVGLSVPCERVLETLSTLGRVDILIPEIRAVVLEIPSNLVSYVASLSFVRYVEEDRSVRTFSEVAWNIELVNATDVWATSSRYGSAAYGYHPTVSVAILDTGVDYAHEDLRGAATFCIVSLRNGKTFYRGMNLANCADPNGHGTHVAGIVAARLNSFGVAGVAPRVTLYAVRVLDPSGSGYLSDIAKGIVEAVKGPDGVPGTEDDSDILSMSLGGSDSQVLRDAVLYAYSYGAVLVAAAGNEGASSLACPACYLEVIAVGAVDSRYRVPSWSNRYPDVVAPGVSILSTLP
ncbi:MAG: S8 family serine peptidase, partial [Sulfolobales archaeon]|nr:S8 family serine peptidase [Sulfolobales archaeon]MDW8010992.1 S8 family serine peptidase [Sulfolobales archaeon]